MTKIRLALITIACVAVVAALAVNGGTSTDTGHADVGDCAWGQCCGANADGSPNNYCRWVAGVACCDGGGGKLAKQGTASGDAQNGWDYDCSGNDCPNDDCQEKSAQLH